jgi:hypothetical protein
MCEGKSRLGRITNMPGHTPSINHIGSVRIIETGPAAVLADGSTANRSPLQGCNQIQGYPRRKYPFVSEYAVALTGAEPQLVTCALISSQVPNLDQHVQRTRPIPQELVAVRS